MYSFVRYVGPNRFGSLVSGVIFMLSEFQIAHLYAGHVTILCTTAWIPLFLLFVEMYLRKRTFYPALLAGLVLAVQVLGGYPGMVFYTAMGGVAYLLFRTVAIYQEERDARTIIRLLLLSVIIPLIAILLSAIQLVPALELTRLSTRSGGISYDFATSFSFPPENLVRFLVPGFFGDGINVPYWGRWYFWELSCYVGILPMILAAAAISLKRDKYIIFFSSLALFSLLMAFGRYVSFFRLLYRFFPGFAMFRGPARSLILFTISSAVLAGFSASYLASATSAVLRTKLLKLGVILIILVVVFSFILAGFSPEEGGKSIFWKQILALSFRQGERLARIDFMNPAFCQSSFSVCRRSLVRLLIFLVLSSVLVFLRAFDWLDLKPVGVLLLLIIVGDLWSFGSKYIVATDPDRCQMPAELRQFLAKDKTIHRVIDLTDAPQNRVMLARVSAAGGNDPALLARYAQLVNINEGRHPDEPLVIVRPTRKSKLFDLLNIKYLLFAPGTRVDHRSLKLVLATAEADVYENQTCVPRAFLAQSARVIAEEDVLDELYKPSFRRREVVLSGRALRVTLPEAKDLPGESVVRIVEYSPTKVAIEARSQRSAFLVLTDTYYPGWRAYVDGKEVQIYRANYVFRAVHLEAGVHKIEFVYRPVSFKIGLVITVLSLCGVAVITVREQCARRRS